ncbi:DUF4383 domain-containing protein [Staphylospora marina]|uniref:DUF4383 domain-containing protein n=1 Tax=Staphylospora marina TaxID=2490858 RepID=UPI0013DE2590|nr:DUF4383 domain-containing protein [Staphylospora marina]
MAGSLMRVLGIVFVILGAVGFFVSSNDIFSMTTSHNVIHLVIGLIFLGVSGNESYSRKTSLAFGVLFLLAGVWGLFSDNFLGLYSPTVYDNLVHLAAGVLASYVGYRDSSGKDESTSA